MKLRTLPIEFQQALPVMAQIQASGYEAYFVGGSVRDVLLGHPIHDVDIATSAFPAEIKAIFPRTVDVGIEHGTVLVLTDEEQYEITTFRTESTYQDFRRPDHVSFVRSLAEDLKRRDFTINAFAVQEDGTVIDLFEGLVDLEAKILRAVGNPHERFHEDALRMMRGLRFVSQLGFTFENETFAAILENHALLGKISVERIFIEFTKLLLGDYRKDAIEKFVATECYQYCPGLREKGAGLLSFAALPTEVFATQEAAWTVLLDQLGLSEELVGPFLRQWKVSNEFRRTCRELLWGLQKRKQASFTPMELYRLQEKALVVESLLPYYGLKTHFANVKAGLEALPIHSLSELGVNGHDLLQHFQKKPGIWLKEVLAYLEQAVVEKNCQNEKVPLLALATAYLKEQG
ncbi:CCA tRNA nucleotidyltransferase [Enterococcus sp. 2201sp1_2201st1_B8_2201SCRN_220225]|uniref:CCA tRNA nucleotidyltransferase n=1 Tax=unclassified Enterococcus TaxID=2608891 RepID=UPI0034A16A04